MEFSMPLLILLIIIGFAWATYHSATIAQQKTKEAEEVLAELAKIRKQYDELTEAYRDALESLRDCQQEDPCDPEYC